MEHILDQKISDLATEEYSLIQLFQKNKIDFYCKGSLTLKEALKNAEVDETEFLNRISKLERNKKKGYSVNIDDWPLDLVADYIQKTHHRFTDQILVKIKTAVNTCLEDGLEGNEMLIAFKEQLELLAKELGGHMKKEELILFPYIRKMIATRGKMEEPRFKTVENPIDMMIHEHDTAFQLLKNIRAILDDYKINDLMGAETNDIVKSMRELDHDLGLHLHLENNILFPKVIEFEKNKLNL